MPRSTSNPTPQMEIQDPGSAPAINSLLDLHQANLQNVAEKKVLLPSNYQMI